MGFPIIILSNLTVFFFIKIQRTVIDRGEVKKTIVQRLENFWTENKNFCSEIIPVGQRDCRTKFNRSRKLGHLIGVPVRISCWKVLLTFI